MPPRVVSRQGWGTISARVLRDGTAGSYSAVAVTVTAGNKPIAIRNIHCVIVTPGFPGLPGRLTVVKGMLPPSLATWLQSDTSDNILPATSSAGLDTYALFDTLLPAANFNNAQSGGFTTGNLSFLFPDGCGPTVNAGESITVLLGIVQTVSTAGAALNSWYSLNVNGGDVSVFSPAAGTDNTTARSLPRSALG